MSASALKCELPAMFYVEMTLPKFYAFIVTNSRAKQVFVAPIIADLSSRETKF